jgi:hypothetical protein
MIRERELDGGGWARLDVSDLLMNTNNDNDAEDDDTSPIATVQNSCVWCEEEQAPGEYLVVADNRNFSVCPTCWGRSAGYLALRQKGFAHEVALGRITGRPV